MYTKKSLAAKLLPLIFREKGWPQVKFPREITNANTQKVVWRWTNSDPFGSNKAQAIRGFEYNLRFAGQVYDKKRVYITTTSAITTQKLGVTSNPTPLA